MWAKQHLARFPEPKRTPCTEVLTQAERRDKSERAAHTQRAHYPIERTSVDGKWRTRAQERNRALACHSFPCRAHSFWAEGGKASQYPFFISAERARGPPRSSSWAPPDARRRLFFSRTPERQARRVLPPRIQESTARGASRWITTRKATRRHGRTPFGAAGSARAAAR